MIDTSNIFSELFFFCVGCIGLSDKWFFNSGDELALAVGCNLGVLLLLDRLGLVKGGRAARGSSLCL